MKTGTIISCCLLIFNNVCCQSGSEQKLIDPHDGWSNFVMDFDQTLGESCPQCECPEMPQRSPAAIEDALSLVYFKKFVNLLFQRKSLQYDATATLYKRSLLFSLLPSQIEELEHVQDARDLDILLTRILERAEAAPLVEGALGCAYAHQGMGVWALVTDILKDFTQLLKISEVQFMLLAALAALAVCIVHKRFRFRLISVILGGVLLCGYFHTYLECNRKLEVDAMLDVINSHQEPLSYDEMSWMQRLRNFVVRPSAEAEQRERLRKSSKLNRTYCLPDHVFIMYINDLFLKQLELLLEKVSQTMTKLTSGLSFPYNLIAPIFLVALVGYIIKLTFKYVISPRAWGTLLHTRPGHTDTPTMLQSQASIAGRETVGDCISGENLKMLLNVIGDTQKSVKQQLPAVSGVQELMGPLEAPSAEDKKPKLDVSNNSSSSSDSKSHSRSQTEEDGFTVVDDHEEDAIHNI
ncbi:uncharacterized protein [Drosophila pseudoobscura]|uniref:Uncharacterized protein isoform X1 n=1 Tax=Drosophila pseudoobscura pseudoobscura TaxID=46245 RepID=A0A6I8UNY6_DROPS|nr:uncharacterized protein LOC4801499 isoform X1 [Drosophila pseudoobscura]